MKKLIIFLMICILIFSTYLYSANSVITINDGASITLGANGDSKSYLINTGEDDGQVIVNSGASFTCWAPETLIDFTASGDGNITLEVILSAFTAQFLENTPTLYWSTNSETDNMGWFIYRNVEDDFTTSEKISDFIEGHGTTSQAQSYIYEDSIETPEVGDTYYYWLESIDFSGIVNHYDKVAVLTIPHEYDPGSGLVPVPLAYGLYQNYPNPFNTRTEIGFALKENSPVTLSVYNPKGQKVITLLDGFVEADKAIELDWDGIDQYGKKLANGIYFYRLQTDKKDYVRKMFLMK